MFNTSNILEYTQKKKYHLTPLQTNIIFKKKKERKKKEKKKESQTAAINSI